VGVRAGSDRDGEPRPAREPEFAPTLLGLSGPGRQTGHSEPVTSVGPRHRLIPAPQVPAARSLTRMRA